MGHGGKREGAGRKKKDRSNQAFFETAEEYLLAVVQGRTEPDTVRVQAAKTLIAYQKAKQRAPVESPSPKKLREKTQKDIAKASVDEFEKKAAKVRARFEKETKK